MTAEETVLGPTDTEGRPLRQSERQVSVPRRQRRNGATAQRRNG
jgi:hypothetical protein